jgi:hypothetical protein
VRISNQGSFAPVWLTGGLHPLVVGVNQDLQQAAFGIGKHSGGPLIYRNAAPGIIT